MPFAKGNCANPGGRPKMDPAERGKWADLAKKAREKLEILLETGECNPTVVARIAEIAANRAWGTPQQSVELTGEDGGPIQNYSLTLEEKEKLIADELARRAND